MRVSRNADKLTKTRKLEFTREYFNKMVIQEAKVRGLARVWVCGPPKMNSEIAYMLVENGFTNKEFLLV